MSFLARTTYSPPSSIPRSYYLGHHRSGLQKMSALLSSISLIIECRDYRVPLSSTNPQFENLLQGRPRLLVFTKRDLAISTPVSSADQARETLLSSHFVSSKALFTSSHEARDAKRVLAMVKAHARERQSLTGSRLLVVGMPNVGKSTLLNALRNHGVHKGKAARTGAQPGITRSIASSVKILEKDEANGDGDVYLTDTPGVFVPYVGDAETMLKLSAVGCVKDGIVPLETVVDYLLFRINLVDPGVYSTWCQPTNEVTELLEGVARKTGRLGKGGVLDLEAAALWVLQRWRVGQLGKFLLDGVGVQELEQRKRDDSDVVISLSQAKKMGKALGRRKSPQTEDA